MQKLRKQYCKQAFRLYCEKIAMQIANERAEDKCDYYLATKRFRKKRTIYNAFLKFTATFNRAKENLNVLVRNMDVWMQRRTFFRWLDQGNSKQIQKEKAV